MGVVPEESISASRSNVSLRVTNLRQKTAGTPLCVDPDKESLVADGAGTLEGKLDISLQLESFFILTGPLGHCAILDDFQRHRGHQLRRRLAETPVRQRLRTPRGNRLEFVLVKGRENTYRCNRQLIHQ